MVKLGRLLLSQTFLSSTLAFPPNYVFHHSGNQIMSSSTNTHNFCSDGAKAPQKSDVYLPTMIVFDLDDCLWSPEMYTLYNKPSIPTSGNLNPDMSKDESDEVGTMGMQVPGGPTVKLFDGARRALREIALDPKYKGVIIAAASSSEEPTYSHSCLEGIEVLPGLTMREMFRYVYYIYLDLLSVSYKVLHCLS